MRGDGEAVDKPVNRLHQISPLRGAPPRGNALLSSEPGAQWRIRDSSPELLRKDLLISSGLANRHAAGGGRETPKGPSRARGESGSDSLYLRTRHGSNLLTFSVFQTLHQKALVNPTAPGGRGEQHPCHAGAGMRSGVTPGSWQAEEVL